MLGVSSQSELVKTKELDKTQQSSSNVWLIDTINIIKKSGQCGQMQIDSWTFREDSL